MIPHVRGSTPSRPSPITRNSNPRSPTKSSTRPDLSLSLSSIIGSTCSSSNRFSSDNATSSFAYAAGAAVVLATVDSDLNVEQRFFRASAGQTIARPLVDSLDHARAGTPVRDEVRRLVGTGRGRAGSPFTGKPTAHASSNENVEGSPSTGHAKDRVKAATAVALSPGIKWLAVGETGYRPRVLIFPVTEKKSTEQPVAILSEHSFGVQAVAWDGEGRLLATLGTVNDGFLFVWSVDDSGKTTLIASNKCTTIVRDMKWMGRSLVTAGVRSVKIWRPDEIAPSMGVESDKDGLSHPGYKPLVGRNVLLGDMLEATFTTIVPLGDTQAALCSDSGDVCILDDVDKQQKLARIAVETFGITSACLDSDSRLTLAGWDGAIKSIDLERSDRTEKPLSRAGTPVVRRADKSISFPIAIGAIPNALVTVDNKHNIALNIPEEQSNGKSGYTTKSSRASHADAILGIRALSNGNRRSATFATWSSDGLIIGWSDDGRPAFQIIASLEQVDDAYELTNELRTIAFFDDATHVVTGDRYGVLRVLDLGTGQTTFDARAHASEITDISIHKTGEDVWVATASRDRTLQVFVWQNDGLELIQTLDEHAGAVSQIAFSEDGRQLLSCSADRTIVVRDSVDSDNGEPVLYVMARTVTLKAAPMAMDFASQVDHILVSTADRLVCLINYQTGRILSTFKTGDSEGGDPVVLSGLVQVPPGVGPGMVAGVSSSDKSIRIYSEDGTLLARDWGHTEGVTDIALLTSTTGHTQRLITVAADGTIFSWSTQTRKAPASPIKTDDVFSSASSSSPLARPPLRKVISHSEMSRLRRSMVSPSEDTESDTPKAPGLRRRPSRLSIAQTPRLTAGTPRSTTPTDLSGSPTSRDRSPSPARSMQSPTRSQRSPDRGPRRRTSQINMKKNLPALDVPPVSLTLETPTASREPSKEPDDPEAELSKRTEEVVGVLRSYRSALCGSQPRNLESQIYSTLRSELESLLRSMSLQEMAPVENQTESTVDYDVDGGSESATETVDVLESVEERSEIF
ncbi:WD40-repeat-containing domain protein [Elsinoe ampelina]|uniref:WD40-repeat-containing domain protein n=1 Tax=Elsinoe ampelina TaxID=302913 RepID=A0A6A6G663_9PEZI|nr:WD40-repeat-containing domain protein [Elsinoe ampelina]